MHLETFASPIEKDARSKDYNIILISTTNIGAAHLGVYGYKRDTSPNIDAFAKDSIVFDNFFTHTSWTLPASISLFTSLYPYQHGVMNRIFDDQGKPIETLKPNITTLIDLLKDDGYLTGAFTGGFDYSPPFGLTNRFDYYTESPKDSMVNNLINKTFLERRRFGSIVDAMVDALKWIENKKRKKFFLFLQGYDTHCPFLPKQPYDKLFVNFSAENLMVDPEHCYRGFNNDGTYVELAKIPLNKTTRRALRKVKLTKKDLEFLEAQYDAEIKYVDDNLGHFIDELKKKGVIDGTIIILLSEHGEMFSKHGRFGRAGAIRGTLYDDVVHTPLIIRHPELQPKRIRELAQLIDVMPTILEFANIPLPANIQGKSLAPLIQHGKVVNEEVYGGSLYGRAGFEYYGLRTINEFIRNNDFKLIHEVVISSNGTGKETYELYHILTDREEKINLINIEESVAHELKKKLLKWSKTMNADFEPEQALK